MILALVLINMDWDYILPCCFYLSSVFFMAALLVLLQITWRNFGELDLRITRLTS